MNVIGFLDQQIAAKERALESNPDFIELRALRAARSAYEAAQRNTAGMAVPSAHIDAEPARRRSAQPMGGKSLEAVSAAIEILRANGQPMRTAQLMPLIERRGIQFGGSAPQSILSSLMSRSPDVVSKGGHIGWALKEWDSAESGGAASVSLSADVQPHSAPVEPGGEVAHDNIG